MTDRELDRRAARRLAVIRHAQEVTGNVSKTCRYYGISRQAYDNRQAYYKCIGDTRRADSRRCGTARRGRTRARGRPRPRS